MKVDVHKVYSEQEERADIHAVAITAEIKYAVDFFKYNKKISVKLNALMEVGLPYISLGQPLSTFSGGEIVFTGTPQEMIENGTTITSKYLRK